MEFLARSRLADWFRSLPDGAVFQPFALRFCWSSKASTPTPLSFAAGHDTKTGTVVSSSVPVSNRAIGGSTVGGVVSDRTVRPTLPVTPPLVAVICALPGPVAVNRPFASNLPVAPVTDHVTDDGVTATGL